MAKLKYECGECGEKFHSYYRTWNGKPTNGKSLLRHKDETNHDIKDAEYRAREDYEAELMADAFDDGYIGDGDYAYGHG